MVKTSIAAATISSVAIALTLSSCKPHPSEASLPQTGQSIPEVAQAIDQQPRQTAPATVGIFPDLSGSMTSARVATPARAAYFSLKEAVFSCSLAAERARRRGKKSCEKTHSGQLQA